MKTVIVHIAPDLRSAAGHHLHWDRALAAAVSRNESQEYISLTNMAFSPPDTSFIPWFSGAEDIARFQQEYSSARKFFRSQYGPAARIVFYMYVGNVSQFLAIAEIEAAGSAQDSLTFAVVNLMRSNEELSHAQPRVDPRSDPTNDVWRLANTMRLLEASPTKTNIRAAVDTTRLADVVEAACGLRLPVFPFVSTDPFYPIGVDACIPATIPEMDGEIVFFAPSHSAADKGVLDIRNLARLAARDINPNWRVVARKWHMTGSVPPSEAKALEDARRSGAELIVGPLAGVTLLELFRKSHIIFLPYSPKLFATRTSGVLLDAIRVGRPVLATKGTWLGDIVDAFGFGRTYRFGDPISLRNAATGLVADYATLEQSVRMKRDEFLSMHSPQRFVFELLSMFSVPS